MSNQDVNQIERKHYKKINFNILQEKLEVVGRFDEKVKKIETFCQNLQDFDKTLKFLDTWMKEADTNLNKIKNESHQVKISLQIIS